MDIVSTHSRPKAAGLIFQERTAPEFVSTHSRPKAAGPKLKKYLPIYTFQHTAARRRLAALRERIHNIELFQHTAARRRLENAN